MVYTTTMHHRRQTTVRCLRHAESTDNAARVYSSRPPGAGLSDRGRAQAEAALLALVGPIPIHT